MSDQEIDPELFLKQSLRDGEVSLTLTKEQAQTLLARLGGYRTKLNSNASKFQKRYSAMEEELSYKKSLLSWARKRLDITKLGTHYSQTDVAKTAILIEHIENIRGRIAAQRILYGVPFDKELDGETVGVLKGAIASAKREKEVWYRYREAAEERRKSKRSPLLAFTEEVWDKINGP